MNRMVYRKFCTSLITLLAILLLAGAFQAASPVSLPESLFVWEPGENLSFTWTNENFDGPGKYAVLELRNEKYLAEYQDEKNDIRNFGDNNPILLHQILIDDNTSHKEMNGSRLSPE